MPVQFFNTLSRSIETFVPLDPQSREVRMYCCGPTIYDFGHIGNFRTFVFSDLVRRYLEFRGYRTVHVMNITDVEDKIIKRVHEAKTTLREFASSPFSNPPPGRTMGRGAQTNSCDHELRSRPPQ